MRPIVIGMALVIALGSAGTTADAQSWSPPGDAQRCPSKWGAADERGSMVEGSARKKSIGRPVRSAISRRVSIDGFAFPVSTK